MHIGAQRGTQTLLALTEFPSAPPVCALHAHSQTQDGVLRTEPQSNSRERTQVCCYNTRV